MAGADGVFRAARILAGAILGHVPGHVMASAFGDDFETAVAHLQRFSAGVREARGYPAAGPHDLAGAASGLHAEK